MTTGRCTDRDDPRGAGASCPVSGTPGQAVGRRTVEHLLIDASGLGQGPFYLCPHADCEVVYFDDAGREVYRKTQLRVRVGLKEREDPIPVCYCFDYTVASLRVEIERTGATTIPARIKAEVAAGNCSCEVKNPSGSCCLGDVNRAVRGIQATRKVTRIEEK